MPSARLATIALGFACLCACKPPLAKDMPTESDLGRGRKLPRETSHADAGTKAPAGLLAHIVASVPEHTVGPLLARGPGGAMAAYLGASPNGARRVVSIPLRTDDSALEAHVVAPAGPDSTSLAFRPSGGGGDGFVAAWTDLTDRGEALFLAGIGKDGAPVTPAFEVARTSNDIVWIEIVPTGRGSLCVWAEESQEGTADIAALALEPNGKPHGVASRVAQGVQGWQVTATTAGALLELVLPQTPPAGQHPSDAHGSTLAFLKLDAEARPVGAVTPVASSSAPITDADVAHAGGSLLFVWTDRSGVDPAVMTALVDGEGHVNPARVLTNGSGGAAFTAIVGSAHGGLLGWEETSKRVRSARRLHLVRFDAGGQLAPADGAVLEIDSASVPELAIADGGFAVLARARACADPPTASDPPCESAPVLPTVVRLDDALHIQSTEPLLFSAGHDAAQLAWSLGCEKTNCSVLIATGESPVLVSLVDVEPGSNRYKAPLPVPQPPGAPRLEGVETLTTGTEMTALSAAKSGGRIYVAALTGILDDPSGKKTGAAGGAVASVRIVGPTGRPEGPAVVVTRRALPAGGIAVSAGGKPADGAAIAWVAQDDGDPEVHVSHVDDQGKLLKDVRLTMTHGDASDVAIAWSEGGWLLSWVDWRDGNGEVYASKVGLDLQRLARDERLTNAAGDASDVTMIPRPGGAWVAWADPRDSPHDGFADIFVGVLRARDARLDGPEVRVLPTSAHSRSPALAPSDDGGAVIGWIEEAPMGVDATAGSAYGAMIAWLDAKGHALADPLHTRGAGDGAPTAIVLDHPGGGVLHALLARSSRDGLSIDALSPAREGAGPIFPILSLDGPPSLDVSLALLGPFCFFNDEVAETGSGRARLAKLEFAR